MKINLKEQKKGLIIDYLSLTPKAPPSYLALLIRMRLNQHGYLAELWRPIWLDFAQFA